jgi:hypothetical protein
MEVKVERCLVDVVDVEWSGGGVHVEWSGAAEWWWMWTWCLS